MKLKKNLLLKYAVVCVASTLLFCFLLKVVDRYYSWVLLVAISSFVSGMFIILNEGNNKKDFGLLGAWIDKKYKNG